MAATRAAAEPPRGPAGAAAQAPDFFLISADGRGFELRRDALAETVLVAVTPDEPGPEALDAWLAAGPRRSSSTLTALIQVGRGRRPLGAAAGSGPLPVLIDPTGHVAALLGMSMPGDVVRVRRSDWSIVDRGRVPGPAAPLRPDGAEPRYEEVARIFARRCVSCHSGPRAPGPTFRRYEDARGWSAMIRETIIQGRMPPWDADPAFGPYKGDLSLTDAEKATVLDWIARGARRQEGADDPLTALSTPTAGGWALGPPDMVLRMESRQRIPPTGEYDWRYVPMLPRPSRDLWVRAVEIRPGNPSAMHHSTLFALSAPFESFPGRVRFRDVPLLVDRDQTFLATWDGGMNPLVMPEGTGELIPRGSHPVLEAHYTPSGRPETDVTEVGLYLLPAPPRRRMRQLGLIDTGIRIPPGTPEHAVRRVFAPDRPVVVTGLQPHMHYRGRSARVWVEGPGGETKTLLSVPRYRFHAQRTYLLSEPQRVDPGSRVVAELVFDNSTRNEANPDPTRTVRHGLSSRDEMALLRILYHDLDETVDPK